MSYPIEALAASLHAACLRDLPEIHYRDHDWAAHRAMMDKLSREQKAELYAKEKASGPVVTSPFEQHVGVYAVTECLRRESYLRALPKRRKISR